MPEENDALSALLAGDSTAGRAWRGYVAHGLFFYRQNDISGFPELLRLGRVVPMAVSPKRPRLPETRGWDLALQALRASSTPAAARWLTRAAAAAPEEGSFLALRGLFRPERYWGSLRLGAAALEDFEAAARLEPEHPWPAFLAGMAEEMRRNYTRSRRWLDAAGAADPRWVWPYILRGICRWYQADFKGSVREFEKALALDPGCVPALLFLSRSKSDLRDRSLVRDLDRALELAPGSGLVLCWRGRAHFVVERTQQALNDLRRAARLLPLYDRAPSWLGISLLESGRSREARPHLERADRLNRYYPTTMYPLARCLMDRGDFSRAGAVLRRAAAVDRDGIWVEHRISMVHPNEACRRSIRDLDRFLAARPRAAWALAWRGQTHLILRQYGAALADLDRAAALAPRDGWTRLWRAESLRRMGYASRALEDFEAALRLLPESSFAWAGKGWCLLESGDAAGAKEALDQSLALQPRCAPALRWRARAMEALGLAAARDRDAAAELRPEYREKTAVSRGASLEDAKAFFSPMVLSAYCAERESPECLRALEAGDPAAALRLAAPTAYPGEVRSFLFRGWLRLAASDASGAVEEASRALDDALDPGCAAALLLRAQAKRALGDDEAAREDERRLAALVSSSALEAAR